MPEHGVAGPDRREAETMLRAFYEHVMQVLAGRATGRVRETIHPDAEMQLLVSFGKPLRGRAAVVDALERGPGAVVFRARIERFEWLDEVTALAFGRARYALEDGGIRDGDVCWLGRLRDGLIWRVQAFTREADARQAYDETFAPGSNRRRPTAR